LSAPNAEAPPKGRIAGKCFPPRANPQKNAAATAKLAAAADNLSRKTINI